MIRQFPNEVSKARIIKKLISAIDWNEDPRFIAKSFLADNENGQLMITEYYVDNKMVYRTLL